MNRIQQTQTAGTNLPQQYTPGGVNLLSDLAPHQRNQLESHISNRPFEFSIAPGGRTSLTRSSAGQAAVGSSSSGGGPPGGSGSGGSSSSGTGTGNPLGRPGAPLGGLAGRAGAPRSIDLSMLSPMEPPAEGDLPGSTHPDGSSSSKAGGTGTPGVGAGSATEKGTGKGRQAGGASDFVKKLYKMLEEDLYKNIVVWGSRGDSFIVKDTAEFTKTILPQHFKHSNFASFVRQLNKYDFHKVKNPEGQSDAPGETYWEFKHPSFSTDQKHSLENIKRKVTTGKKPETPLAGPGQGRAGDPVLGTGKGMNGQGQPPSGLPQSFTGPSQQGQQHPSPLQMGGGASPAQQSQAPSASANSPANSGDVELMSRQIAVLTHNQKQIEVHMERFAAQYQALMADLLGQHRAIAAQDAFTANFLQYMINLESRLNVLSNPAEPPVFPPSGEAQHLMATYSELSRARYDKMTESNRRAEALGLFINGMRRSDGADGQLHQQQPNGGAFAGQGMLAHQRHSSENDPSPEFGQQMLPGGYGNPQQHSGFPHHQGPPFSHMQQQQHPHGTPLHHPQAQYPGPHHHQQDAMMGSGAYFPKAIGSIQPDESPANSSEATYDSGERGGSAMSGNNSRVPGPSSSFANLGEIRLGGNDGGAGPASARLTGFPHLQHQHQHQPQHQQQQNAQDSYFPAPGSAPLRPSVAITPGAVMISTMNNVPIYSNSSTISISNLSNNMEGTREASQATPDGDILSPNTAGLTAANTSRNRDPVFLAEGEDIAAFAAALKGGQSSAAVRSALTSQPLLVRRATYIPGWSVPPRVLLVEDDAVCRNLTTRFLQIFGCTIDVAADGVEAVNKMQTGVYDVCLMDISMPNLDGVSATSLIRQFDAMTPIISMTGNSRPDEVLTYFSHGMNDVLPKPFTKEGVLSMLEKHLLHLKNIHQNPEIAPDVNQLEELDTESFDPTSGENPFLNLGISNEDYLNLISSGNGTSGSAFRWSVTPSPSPGTGAAGQTSSKEGSAPVTLGKRGQQDSDSPQLKDGPKRARFLEM